MRYSPAHKEGTRTRLLAATGAVVKQQGFAATGVDGLMAAAGLTSGAFYSHFRSKSELLEAIIEKELKRSLELFSTMSLEQAMAAIDGYLSLSHVAHPESGCALPSLTPEIARASAATQLVFEQGMIRLKDQIQHLVEDEAAAWSITTQLVGAVMIARAIPTEETRRTLLNGVMQQVKYIMQRQR